MEQCSFFLVAVPIAREGHFFSTRPEVHGSNERSPCDTLKSASHTKSMCERNSGGGGHGGKNLIRFRGADVPRSKSLAIVETTSYMILVSMILWQSFARFNYNNVLVFETLPTTSRLSMIYNDLPAAITQP